MYNDKIALLIPALGLTDLDEMLASMGANRFDECIIAIDKVGSQYVPQDKRANLNELKEKYPWTKWYDYTGLGMINGAVNEAYIHSTSDWLWITHEDILFPQQISPHPNYRYDLRLKTAIADLKKMPEGPVPIKSIMMHYFQLPNKLDTRMFAHLEGDRYVSDLGGGGGNTGISSLVHRSVIESIEQYHNGRGFDLEFATYYDTQIIADSCVNPWISIAVHDAPAILHKVSAGGRYTRNCNDFEQNKKWKNIGENADAWRAHVQAQGKYVETSLLTGKRCVEGKG